MVNKSNKATFLKIAGFVCKFSFIISCDKGKHSRLGRMVKEIAFWYIKQVLSIRLDVNSSKGISEEVAKSLGVSLSHVNTYFFNG